MALRKHAASASSPSAGNPCWFTSPDGAWSFWSDCGEEFCWVQFQYDVDESFYEPVPCEGYSFCNFTSPDGLSTITTDCEYPTCWSMAPGSAEWTQVYDCDPPQDWCWFAQPGAPELSILEWCSEPVEFAVNVPDGGTVSSPWQTRLYDSNSDWCWPVPPDPGSFEAFVTFCNDVGYITWFQLDDGSWVSSYGPYPCGDLGSPDGPPIPLPVQPEGGVDIIEPCLPDEELTEGVPGDVVPVESVAVDGVPAEVVEGQVETIDPQPSSLVEPLVIVQGQVEQFDPLPSVSTAPAALEPSERVEEITADFPEDVIILPIDGGGPGAPPFPTDGSDRDETITTPNDPNDVIIPGDDNNKNLVSNPNVENKQTDSVSGLPSAGTGEHSSRGIPAWIYAALALFGVATTGFAYGRIRLKA
jgi:hypothetical protein